MNPYVVSGCFRASLRFPYANGLACAAASKHVELTHRLRIGVCRIQFPSCQHEIEFPNCGSEHVGNRHI